MAFEDEEYGLDAVRKLGSIIVTACIYIAGHNNTPQTLNVDTTADNCTVDVKELYRP